MGESTGGERRAGLATVGGGDVLPLWVAGPTRR
jgi:hypothetical protein